MSALPARAGPWIVLAVALLALGFNLQNVGIASGTIDTVTHLGAQDEAVYTREAIHMATRGGWLTPTYLDRFILFKPPLLMWLSGASMKIFGIHPLAARLPAVFAGALVCAIAFGAVAKARSIPAAGAAVLLLISNQLFHTMARLNMTDIPLTACVTGALVCWMRGSAAGFAIATAGAIMTKSIAGLLPMGAALLFVLLVQRDRWKRLLFACGMAAALALPWHLYQFAVHRNWFLAEYLGVQLVVFGARPPQTSQEHQLGFYAARLALGDPVLTLVLLSSLWFVWRKRKEPLAALLLCWIAVFGAALFVFQYRSVQYTLPIVPALVLVSAIYSPLFSRPAAAFAIPILAVAFALKAAIPGKTWSVPYVSGNTLASAAPLSRYCEQRRAAELIVLFPDDEFYSSVLPLPRVRYAWIDADDVSAQQEPHLRYLGITLTPAQFARLPEDREMYRERLKSWGLDSPAPAGTAIIAHDLDDMRQLILTHAGSDFLAPKYLLDGIEREATRDHDIAAAGDDRVFLLAIHPLPPEAMTARWSCEM